VERLLPPALDLFHSKFLVDRCLVASFGREPRGDWPMKDFPNASFPPDTIKLMKDAMEAAVETLPHPVSSAHLQSIAETILRTAKEGERDAATLQRMALLELQIRPRD
jgi:hypothetical protein